MREAIERVIAELEKRRNNYADHAVYSAVVATQYAIDKLKAVLAEHGTHDRSGIPGTNSEEAEQIPGAENQG